MKPPSSVPSSASPDKRVLSSGQQLVWVLLFLVPAVMLMAKLPGSPASDFLLRYASLRAIPVDLAERVNYVLFVPLGALLVVFFRLSLGVRLLGPFRSILIAVAFQITGIVAGLAFLGAVIGIIVAARPFIKALRLPYFARVSVMLSAVSLLMVLAIYTYEWLGIQSLAQVAYFPIVVICLTAEGFARALNKEGLRSALWRGSMTALVAVLITLTASIRELKNLLSTYPELLFAQVGGILIVAYYGDRRLLEAINPPPRKTKQRRKSQTAKRRAAKSGELGELDDTVLEPADTPRDLKEPPHPHLEP